jgi:hypothetical protein
MPTMVAASGAVTCDISGTIQNNAINDGGGVYVNTANIYSSTISSTARIRLVASA